jgi:uncharacterized membrane protein
MAATKQRSSPTRRARGASAKPTKKVTQARKKAAEGAKRGAKSGAKEAAGGVAKKAADAVKPSAVKHPFQRMAVAAALKGLKLIARKALEAAGEGARSAADRTVAAGKEALDSGLSRRLPIQVSIDVAVPLEFAWEQWMTFESFTEGVHRIEDVERDGDRLFGRTASPLSADWEAEITDEREYADFAWRSVQGSDCAGLAAFRPLSERLTRVQLDLDVLPTRPGESLALALHLAHRRADAELRRFKARLEFTNPDSYEPELRRNGSGPNHASDEKENG